MKAILSALALLVLSGCSSPQQEITPEPSCTKVCKASYYWVCGINDVCLISYTATPDKDNCFAKEYREEGASERICGTYSLEPQMTCDCIPTSDTIAPSAHD